MIRISYNLGRELEIIKTFVNSDTLKTAQQSNHKYIFVNFLNFIIFLIWKSKPIMRLLHLVTEICRIDVIK